MSRFSTLSSSREISKTRGNGRNGRARPDHRTQASRSGLSFECLRIFVGGCFGIVRIVLEMRVPHSAEIDAKSLGIAILSPFRDSIAVAAWKVAGLPSKPPRTSESKYPS